MPLASTGKMRSTIIEEIRGLKIIIPSKKRIFILAFLSFWLVGWAAGEVMTIKELITGDFAPAKIALIIWLCGWTAGGLFFMHIWLWLVFGKEIALVDKETLSIKKDIFGYGKVKEFNLNEIRNMRVSPSSDAGIFDFNRSFAFWRGGEEIITFDHGSNTHRFATGIEEAEASVIISRIMDYSGVLKRTEEDGEIKLPKDMHSNVNESEEGLNIVIKPKRKFFKIFSLAFPVLFLFSAVVVMLVLSLTGNMPPPRDPEAIPILIAVWGPIWLICTYGLLWTLFGKEIINVNGEILSITRKIFGDGKNKEYDMGRVHNIRVSPPHYSNIFSRGFISGIKSLFSGNGVIAFDYDMKTYRFAGGIEEAEARIIVEKIKNDYSTKASPFAPTGDLRSEIITDTDELKITLPVKKNYFIIALILVTFLFSLPKAISDIVRDFKNDKRMFMDEKIFFYVFLCFSAFFIIAFILIFFRQMLGKDVISANSRFLSINHDFFIFSRKQEYDINTIKNLRVAPVSAVSILNSGPGSLIKYFLYGNCMIAFDYGMKTYRFASGIEEAEAEFILNKIKQKCGISADKEESR